MPPTWIEGEMEASDDPAAPTTPARALDAAFQPSATKHVLCMYTVDMVVDEGESSVVELASDAANPPTTVRCSAKLVVGAANADAVTARQQLTYVCPPGHYVKLINTSTGVATIANQAEMVIS